MDFHRKGVNVLWKGKLLSVVIKKISIVPQTIFIFSVKKDEKTVKPCDRSTTDSPRVEITAIIFGSKREREREKKRGTCTFYCALSLSFIIQPIPLSLFFSSSASLPPTVGVNFDRVLFEEKNV